MPKPATLFLCCLILACVISDIRNQVVPGCLSTALGLTALFLSPQPWPERWLGLAGCVLPFLAIYMIRDDLGGADVRFAAALGAALGLSDGLACLTCGLLSFIVSASALRLIRRGTGTRQTQWPLIPWLAWPWLLHLFI